MLSPNQNEKSGAEDDLPKEAASTSSLGWSNEQAEALLGDHYEEDTEGEQEEKVRSNYYQSSSRLRWFGKLGSFIQLCAVLALIIFAALSATIFLLVFPRPFLLPSTHDSASATAVQVHRSFGDYTIGPKWGYDAQPRRREYWWNVEDVEFNPNGVYRPMMVINRQFPGPMIECNEGDTIVVHVQNMAVNATSFHWHGIYQTGTNWMDGTVGITQCPIAPGSSFTYEFQVSGQSGTYWYHAHQGVQASDGLFGPFVVHGKDERELQELPYATDRVIMVQDHYHDLSSALLMKYLASDRENAEPVPDGALINGLNIRDCDTLPHRKCDNSSASVPRIDLAPNQNHRLRIINTGAFAEFQIQIDEHEFALTEVDGTNVKPAYFHRLNINPGQRYSIVVSANVTTADSFWLRARMVTHCFAEPNPDLEPEIRAIVSYVSETSSTFAELSHTIMQIPQSVDWSEVIELVCKDMNTTQLIPLPQIAAPPKADASFYLRSNFEIGNWRLSRGFFNSSSWRADPYQPSLQRVMDGYSANNASFTPSMTGINKAAFNIKREMVLQVDGIKTIDILIMNFDDGNHPLHLHGHKYFVLGQGHGYFDYSTYDSIDVSNPLRRDTASVEAYGWTLLRIVTDNPGLWALHCHIAWHTEAGMLMQLLSSPDIVAKWKLPEENLALCRADGLEKGMSPKDELWYGNTGGGPN